MRRLGASKTEFGMANSFAAVTGFRDTYSFKKSGPVKNRLVVQGAANHRADKNLSPRPGPLERQEQPHQCAASVP